MTAIDWSRPVCARCGQRNVALPLTTCGACYRAIHGDTPETEATLARLMTGADLRQRREALGLTQAQLGALLGKPQKTISRWERGDHRIESPVVLDLALRTLERENIAESAQKTP